MRSRPGQAQTRIGKSSLLQRQCHNINSTTQMDIYEVLKAAFPLTASKASLIEPADQSSRIHVAASRCFDWTKMALPSKSQQNRQFTATQHGSEGNTRGLLVRHGANRRQMDNVCLAADETLIGKTSTGWSLGFQGQIVMPQWPKRHDRCKGESLQINSVLSRTNVVVSNHSPLAGVSTG